MRNKFNVIWLYCGITPAAIYYNANIRSMKGYLYMFLAMAVLASCQKEKEKVEESPGEPNITSYEPKLYTKKSSTCKKECTHVRIETLEAKGGSNAVADSINTELFRAARSIVYFGEKPTNAKDYEELTGLFVKAYDDLAKKYPEEADIPWDAKIITTVVYQDYHLINIKVNSYMFTGGAHGYEADRSIFIEIPTGKKLKRSDIFKDEAGLTAYAETKFREQYKIPTGKPLNSTGLMFEKNMFRLPQNIFFDQTGINLIYNPLEIGSFADGRKEVHLTFKEVEKFMNSTVWKHHVEPEANY